MDGSEVLDDLMTLFPTQPMAPKMEAAKTDVVLLGEEEIIYTALGTGEAHINEITERSGLMASLVSATLMKLEMKRLVKPLPGRYYTRLV
jgi:DNA processing protein